MYSKQTWTDNVSPLSAARFQSLEDGLAKAAQLVGSGTSLPAAASVQTGDLYYHSGLGCLFVYAGAIPGWVQENIPTAANATQVAALVSSSSAAFYRGFRLRQTDSNNTLEWNGTAFKAVPDYTFPVAFARASAAQNSLPAGWQQMALQTVDIDSHSGFTPAPNGFTVPTGQDGTYALEGNATFGNIAAGSVVNAQIRKNGTALPSSWGTTFEVGANTLAAGGAATGRKLVALAAGDVITLWGFYSASTWATYWDSSNAPSLSVERLR